MSFFFINCNSQDEIKTISTSALKTLLVKDNVQLLDVRTKATAQLDKNKPVYLYCRSGNRSEKAAKILKEKGYEVYNVLGGYNKWKQEN